MKRFRVRVLSLAAAAAAAGCATTVPVKEVVSDPGTYLKQFATVSPEIIAKLPKNEPAIAFMRMEIETKSTEIRTDQKPGDRDLTATRVLTNGGGNLVHAYDTIRNNGVPFRINYRTSYRGVVPLKWQTVFLNRQNTDVSYEIKTVKQFDSLATGRDKAEFNFSYGSQPQIANYYDGREVCTLGPAKPARELHATLAGSMIEVSCDNYGANGQFSSKATYAYLSQYGVAVQISFVDSTTRTTNHITSLRIE